MASPEDGTTGLTEAESLRPAASPVSEKDSGHHALLVAFNQLKTKYLDTKEENLVLRNRVTHQNQATMEAKVSLEEVRKELYNTQAALDRKEETCVKLQNELKNAKHNERLIMEENERLRMELELLNKGFPQSPSDLPPIFLPPDDTEQLELSPRTTGRERSGSTEDKGLQTGDVQTLLSEEKKIVELEKQIQALTTEKKQYMTHVHWLTNKIEKTRHVESSNLSSPTSKSIKHSLSCVSLEEGSGISNGTDDGVRTGTVENTVADKISGRTALLIKNLKKIKEDMVAAKSILQEDKQICDSIYQNAVQKVRHPREPKSYSEWDDLGICSVCMQKRNRFTQVSDNKEISEEHSKAAGLMKPEKHENLTKFDSEMSSYLNTGGQFVAELKRPEWEEDLISSKEKPMPWDSLYEEAVSKLDTRPYFPVQPVCTSNGTDVPVALPAEPRVLGPPHYLAPPQSRRSRNLKKDENMAANEATRVRPIDETHLSVTKNLTISEPNTGPPSLTDRGSVLAQPQLEDDDKSSFTSSGASSFEIISRESVRR